MILCEAVVKRQFLHAAHPKEQLAQMQNGADNAR